MDPQFRIDGVSDGFLLAMEWASNCVFRLFECVCDVATIWIIVDSDNVDGSHFLSVLNWHVERCVKGLDTFNGSAPE
jgi:hypothetical protein